MLAKDIIEFYKNVIKTILKKGIDFCNITLAIQFIFIQKNTVFANKILKKTFKWIKNSHSRFGYQPPKRSGIAADNFWGSDVRFKGRKKPLLSHPGTRIEDYKASTSWIWCKKAIYNIRWNPTESSGLPPTIFEGQTCALKEGKNPCYCIREWE